MEEEHPHEAVRDGGVKVRVPKRAQCQVQEEKPVVVKSCRSRFRQQEQQCEKSPSAIFGSSSKLEEDKEELGEEVVVATTTTKRNTGEEEGDCKFAYRPSTGSSQSGSCPHVGPAGRLGQAMTMTAKVKAKTTTKTMPETTDTAARMLQCWHEQERREINAPAKTACLRGTPEADTNEQATQRPPFTGASCSSSVGLGTRQDSGASCPKKEAEGTLIGIGEGARAGNHRIEHEIDKQQQDTPQVCHLTARTSDNQCALHKATGNYPISLAQDQANRKICLRLTPISEPKTKTTISGYDDSADGGITGVGAADDNQLKQRGSSKLLDSYQAGTRRGTAAVVEATTSCARPNDDKNQSQNLDQATMVISENKLSNIEIAKAEARAKEGGEELKENKAAMATLSSAISGTRVKRLKRRHPFNPEKFGPTWPIAKRTLNDNSSFGDCEDISSAHLTGRLFHFNNRGLVKLCQAKEIRIAKGRGKGATSTLSSATTSKRKGGVGKAESERGTTLEEFLNSEQVVWQREQIISELATCANSSYNHKRPFAQPFERPTAGWIYNAIGAERVSKRTRPQSLKGKLLVSGIVLTPASSLLSFFHSFVCLFVCSH